MRISDWSSDVCSSDLSDSWQPLGNDPANLLLTDQSVIVPVGQLTHSRNHAMAFDKDGIPYVAFVEARGDNVVMVKCFVDGAWEEIGRSSARERGCPYGEC